MGLIQNVKGVSRLVTLLLLIIAFVLGATLSYVWTLGFYASNEFRLPSETSLTIENVQFFAENANYFNLTVLNPSYSPSDAQIQQIRVSTSDGQVHSVVTTDPTLPFTLAAGKTQTVKVFWIWGGYAGQSVDVYVIIANGSGPAVRAEVQFMNLTVTSVSFEPSVTVARFNVTVESKGSPITLEISSISVNDEDVSNVSPDLPYDLNPGGSVTFTLSRDWIDLQNTTVSVTVFTTQGFTASKVVTAPMVTLELSNIVFFNTTLTSFYFNATVRNLASSAARVDVNSVTVNAQTQTVTVNKTDVSPSLPYALDPNSESVLTCSWNWSSFRGQNATITVGTIQGFAVSSAEQKIPSAP